MRQGDGVAVDGFNTRAADMLLRGGDRWSRGAPPGGLQ
jgi:hypothetical protein